MTRCLFDVIRCPQNHQEQTEHFNKTLFLETTFENVVWNMLTFLSRPQYVPSTLVLPTQDNSINQVPGEVTGISNIAHPSFWRLMPRCVFYLCLRKILPNEWRRYISNVFSHWLITGNISLPQQSLTQWEKTLRELRETLVKFSTGVECTAEWCLTLLPACGNTRIIRQKYP